MKKNCGKLGAFCMGVALVTLAVPVCAQQDVPWTTSLTKRDMQMRSVTGWGYQPGSSARGGTAAQQQQEVPVEQVPLADRPAWKKTDARVEVFSDPSLEPRTETSLDAGFQFSHYKYYEKVNDSNFMSLNGLKYGFTGSATGVIYGDWFARIEGRYAFGDVDYSGSGEMKNLPDDMYEIRGVVGADIPYGRVVVAPYIGMGFRHLFNDMRGVTSTGQFGYRRTSKYLFVPLGVQPRYQIDRNSRISLGLELDPLLKGWQFSQLSDTGLGLPDITSKQPSGYGFKGELMYQYARLSVGPFVNFWDIDDSNFSCETAQQSICGIEPHNKTLEYGIQARARLY